MQPSTGTSTFSTDELAGIKQNFDAMRASAKPQTAKSTTRVGKSPGGVKGVLEGLLPLAGGALGAIGGSFLGGPVGTAAGGAGGSALGEALKEHLQGGPISVKNVAEQGVLGALPGVGSGIKTLRAGGEAADLIKGTRAATTAGEAVTTAPKPNLGTKIYNKGVITEGRAGGFGQGEKVTGGSTQGFRNTEQNAQTLAGEGVNGGSASTRQIAVGDKLDAHAKTINAAVDANNPAYTEDHRIAGLQQMQDKIIGNGNGTGIPGYIVGDNANSKFATSLLHQYSTVKDAKGLLSFRRALDNQAINYGRNSAAPDPIKEQIAKALRDVVSKDFNKMVPEAAKASTSYAKLHDANEFLKQAAADASNNATKASGGLASRALTSDTAEAARSKGGRLMQTIGKAIGGKPGAPEQAATTTAAPKGNVAQLLTSLTSPTQVGKGIVKQGVARGVGGLLGLGGDSQPQQPTAQPLADGTTVQAPDQSGSPLDLTGASQAGEQQPPAQTQTDSSPYSEQAYLSDVQRDPKNATTYTTLFKELNPNFGSAPSSGLNVSPVTAQNYGLAQNGAQALQGLSQLLQSDPSVLNKSAIPGRGLPIVGGVVANAAGTGSYDALSYKVADAILRLQTGAQANDSEMKDLQSKLALRAGDSPQTVQTKLTTMASIFNNVLQLANQQGGGTQPTTSDLAASLGQ